MTLDVNNFYIGTDLDRFEYLRMATKDIPQEIVEQYNLPSITNNRWVYMEVRKGIPELKQTGKIANVRLTEHLAKYGYAPIKCTPAL